MYVLNWGALLNVIAKRLCKSCRERYGSHFELFLGQPRYITADLYSPLKRLDISEYLFNAHLAQLILAFVPKCGLRHSRDCLTINYHKSAQLQKNT